MGHGSLAYGPSFYFVLEPNPRQGIGLIAHKPEEKKTKNNCTLRNPVKYPSLLYNNYFG